MSESDRETINLGEGTVTLDAAGKTTISNSERSVLGVFRKFRVSAGEMLCFYGPNHKKHRAALRQLIAKGMVIEERFSGGYSLTQSGFAAMKECE